MFISVIVHHFLQFIKFLINIIVDYANYSIYIFIIYQYLFNDCWLQLKICFSFIV